MVRDEENIFPTTLTTIQMQEIDTDHLEWCRCDNGYQGGTFWDWGGLAGDTGATVLHEVLNVGFHVGPIETLPSKTFHFLDTQVAHFRV